MDVALVDDPPRVVVADAVGRVTIWNRETGLQDVSLPRQENPLTAVVASRDGRRIAVATRARLTLWDTATAEPLWEKWVHNADPSTVAITKSGGFVVARTAENGVTVWRGTSREQARFGAPGAGRVTALSLSSNGRVAIASSTGAAGVWDIRSQQLLFKAPKQPAAIRSAHLSPDGSFLATGGADGVVNVWNVATGTAVGQFQAGRTITSVKVKHRGTRVLTATGTGRLALRDTETGHFVRGYARKGVDVRQIALSRDGRTLATIGDGYGLWQAGTGRGQPAPGSKHLVAGVALSHDGSRVIAEFHSGGCVMLDTQTGRALYDIPPGSRTLAAIERYGTLRDYLNQRSVL